MPPYPTRWHTHGIWQHTTLHRDLFTNRMNIVYVYTWHWLCNIKEQTWFQPIIFDKIMQGVKTLHDLQDTINHRNLTGGFKSYACLKITHFTTLDASHVIKYHIYEKLWHISDISHIRHNYIANPIEMLSCHHILLNMWHKFWRSQMRSSKKCSLNELLSCAQTRIFMENTMLPSDFLFKQRKNDFWGSDAYCCVQIVLTVHQWTHDMILWYVLI